VLLLDNVLEVKRLLDEGRLSRRSIARITGISRGSVNAIANGDRGLVGAELQNEVVRSLVAERCVACGGLVYMPCVLCEARRYAANQTAEHSTSTSCSAAA
jgi:DNA-binding CsgD family transcriptional regulator